MSEVLLDAVKPADLTRFARELAAEIDGGLVRFLPNRQIDGTRSRQTRVSRTTKAARLRAWDAETPLGQRPVTRTTTEIDLQPIGQKLWLRESEIVALAHADGEWRSVLSMVYDDTETNVANVRNLAESMRAEFLFTGALDLDDNGVKMTADFGLADTHNIAIDAGHTPWDNTGATPLTDELEWMTRVQDDSGEQVIATIGSTEIRRQLMRSEEYLTGAGTLRSFLTVTEFNELRTAMELPPFVVYDEKVDSSRLTPANKIAMVTASVGETQWGVTAEELKLLGSRAVETAELRQPRIMASAWDSTDPVNVFSKANATMLVVAGDINGLLVAEVLAGSEES